jgi:hypothetical protein
MHSPLLAGIPAQGLRCIVAFAPLKGRQQSNEPRRARQEAGLGIDPKGFRAAELGSTFMHQRRSGERRFSEIKRPQQITAGGQQVGLPKPPSTLVVFTEWQPWQRARQLDSAQKSGSSGPLTRIA